MDIIQTFIDLVNMIIFRVVLPIAGIIVVIAVITALLSYTKIKDHVNSVTNRYEHPTRPVGYRVSNGITMCSNCDHSCRSYSEKMEWYCQKHHIDTMGNYVCDNYYTCLF